MFLNAYRKTYYLFFTFLFILCLNTYGSQSPAISSMRIQKISKIISKYKEAGENLNDNDVAKTILKDVSELYRLEPEAKKNAKTTQEIGKTVREKVTQKFPDNYETLKKKAETEAEKTFVMSKILDYVTVKYLKGEKPYEAEGYFFSYGSTGNSINVGGTVIALYDLVPEDRVRFDAVSRNQRKESFVQTKIRDYYSRKNAYSVQVYNEVRDAVIKENEDNGYIFYMNDWRNPKEVATLLMKDIQSPAVVPDKVTPKAVAVASNAQTTAPTPTAPQDDPKTPGQAKEDPSIAKKREAIRKIAEEKQLDNNTRNAGIDADPGFELAYWGMKKDEFALLYPQYSNALAGDTAIINYEKGPITRLELHFTSDILFKVVYAFRIGPQEGMLSLGRKIRDKYGLTDQEKLDAADPAKADRKDPCDGAHFFVKGSCTKCGWGEAELVTPIEQLYVWTGKETKGQLVVKLTPEKTAYTEFCLIKENPRIKDDIAADVNLKKKKEAEENRRKLLEGYNEFK